MRLCCLTVHGFRSCFRDWCAEATAHPREVAEQALAHALSDRVEAAYRRGDMLGSGAGSCRRIRSHRWSCRSILYAGGAGRDLLVVTHHLQQLLLAQEHER